MPRRPLPVAFSRGLHASWSSHYCPPPHFPRRRRPTPLPRAPVEALLIGDSVLNGLAQPYSAAGRAALRRPSLVHPRQCGLSTTDHDELPDSARIGADERNRRAARQGRAVLTVPWWWPPATTIRPLASSGSARQST